MTYSLPRGTPQNCLYLILFLYKKRQLEVVLVFPAEFFSNKDLPHFIFEVRNLVSKEFFMGRINSRAKGANGERELAKKLRDFGFSARRGQQFSGGADSPDVVCEELPFHWEVKRVDRLNIEDAMQQSERDCGEFKIPIVAHRRNNEEWKVTIRLDEFLSLAARSIVRVGAENVLDGISGGSEFDI
jgi:Holliday junction resolvase